MAKSEESKQTSTPSIWPDDDFDDDCGSEVSCDKSAWEIADDENNVFDDDIDFMYLNSIDPNINLFNSLTYASPLLTPDELSSLNFNNHFSLLHLNCRSIFNKLPQFNVFLNNCNVPFSLIGLTETWLNENNVSSINVSNFQFISKNRSGKVGGGVGFLINNNVNYLIRYDLKIDDNICDFLAVEIVNQNSPNLIICLIYRPSNIDTKLSLHNNREYSLF